MIHTTIRKRGEGQCPAGCILPGDQIAQRDGEQVLEGHRAIAGRCPRRLRIERLKRKYESQDAYTKLGPPGCLVPQPPVTPSLGRPVVWLLE